MLNLSHITQIPGVEIYNGELLENASFSGVSIDSRQVSENELFVAIKGERFDAHEFIGQVAEKGVKAFFVNKSWYEKNKALFPGLAFIVTHDSTKGLGDLANAYRKSFSIPFIAVAGSNGKTTTKEMTAIVLSQKYNVLKTEGNLNNHIGVPLTLLKLKKEHEVAVVEIGTNHFGEIEYLCNILEPDYGIMTNIGREHLEFFKDIEGVARGEGEMFEYLSKANKFACINNDDKWIRIKSADVKKKITYALNDGADIKAVFKGLDELARPSFEVQYGNKIIDIKLQMPGEHAVYNALAAFSVGTVLNLTEEQIKNGLESYASFSKRMEVNKINGITVINDCYNANPDSMEVSLRTLSQIRTGGKKIAVLGDMAELGDQSAKAHEELGETVAKAGVDYLFTIGELISLTHNNALKRGVRSIFTSDKEVVLAELKKLLNKNDVLLLKGSRSMKLEELLEKLF